MDSKERAMLDMLVGSYYLFGLLDGAKVDASYDFVLDNAEKAEKMLKGEE